MPQLFTHLRTVAVFPGDVKAEKSSLQRIIEKINKDSANSQGLHLDFLAWDADASPTFDPLGPQGSIDKVLRLDSSDLVIGIFWHRLGTTTADGTTGSEHELTLAYHAWLKCESPEIKVYFLQTKYFPKTDEDFLQHQNLVKFKKGFGGQHRFFWDCRDKRHFEEEVERHLRKYVADKAAYKAQKVFAHKDSLQGGWPDVQTTVPRKEPSHPIVIPKLDAVSRERALVLLTKPEFSEIRATFGETLGVRFVGNLLRNDVTDTQQLLDTCGFTKKRREHLLKVAEEAVSYYNETQT